MSTANTREAVELAVRPARDEDLTRLREIYNHYIEHTHITFDTEAKTLDERRAWLEGFAATGPHRLYVAESGGQVEGYASSHAFRPRAAYASSVEVSVYLAPESTTRGLGSALYRRLLEMLEAEEGIHRAYGGVALPNEASIALHERFGFAEVARFSEVGYKFGRYWDVVWFERAV